jgi:peptide/nickel transport system permease protein
VSSAARRRREIVRYLRFVGVRSASVLAALVLGMLLVVIIANLGGKIDQIIEADIRFSVGMVFQDPTMRKQIEERCKQECLAKGIEEEGALRNCIEECKMSWVETQVEILKRARGLDKPFAIRVFYYLGDALTLNLGRAIYMHSDTGSSRVWDIIIERLPNTILLFTTANLIIFFAELFLGLMLSRKYGTILDKLAVSLAPLSSMPGWFYGLFMIIIFAFWLKILPSGGMISPETPPDPLLRALDIMRHMILPLLSWLIAYVPIGVYYYRTFFLMFSTEEYVEYARARGIPPRIIERRYILRPTLPPIITTLVLTLIGSWMGAIITESIFRWPGLGSVLAEAIARNDSPVIVGIIAVYAYLLAISVIALDFIYGIVDPRVRVGGE